MVLMLCFDLLTQPNMLFQGDAPEGSDTFQWQLGEEIAWAEIGWWNGMSKKNSHGTLQSDAPEESDLWTAWQLFPLNDN